MNTIFKKEVQQRQNVCPKCEHHFYVSATDRIEQVVDEGTFEELNDHLRPTDPLEFQDRKKVRGTLWSANNRGPD